MASAPSAAAPTGAAVVVGAAATESFPLLCLGTAGFGVGNTSNLLARYAATDLAPAEGRARAISVVLIALPTASAWLSERERRAEASSPDDSPSPTPVTLPALGLTPRQSEVVDLLAKGRRHGEIAKRLGISVHQVRHLLSQARSRTDAKTTRQLVASRFEPPTSDRETGSGRLHTETTSAIS